MNYVTCNVFQNMGRLGNQLFQAAATIGYGLKFNKKFVFPRWSYSEYFKLPVLNITEKLHQMNESSLRYTDFYNIDGDVNIHGHLLSEKYFDNYRDFILNLFKLDDKWENYIKEKYKYVFNDNITAIHVRRGDYLLPDQIGHGVLPIEYYDLAKRKIEDICGKQEYVVFSDDISWCKENIKADYYIENEKDIIDLFLISKCKNVIIANSTFSWWGAWLNQGSGIVVAPRQWFLNTEGWDDLYRNEWIKIKKEEYENR